MKYHSLSHSGTQKSLKEIAFQATAADGSLFFPNEFPSIDKQFIKEMANKDFHEIATTFLHPYLDEFFSKTETHEIVKEALNFPFKLVEVSPKIYTLELFHGPTLSFKDVGARFMSRVMSRLLGEEKITILAATSGDTGSAVAHGFYKVPNIEVILLYPKGKVSKVQEQQFTTLGENITALAVEGTFDDCQALVKQAFKDQELRQKINISSANSINFLRLVAQMSYYLWTYQQLSPKVKDPIHICVPSGNFGNITSGKIADTMGIPFGDFVVATNENDVVPAYLAGKPYQARPSVSTLSNAMDVGAPNNFPRLTRLFNDDFSQIKKRFYGYKVTDAQTVETIKRVYDEQGYLLDPHGAVGYLAIEQHLAKNEGVGVFLETAHPAKFIDTVEETIGKKIEIPERLATCLEKQKQALDFGKDYESFRAFVLERN